MIELISYDTDKDNYNTYIEISDIEDIKDSLPFQLAELEELDDVKKGMYFRTASKQLDNLGYVFKFKQRDVTQYLKFPRDRQVFENETTIPYNIKVCTYLLAYMLVKEVNNNMKDGIFISPKNKIIEEKIGRTLSVKYQSDKDNITNSNKDNIIKDIFGIWIRDYIVRKGLYLKRG
jgi:hypothetical protein